MNEAELNIETQSGLYITPGGYSMLQKELEELTTVKRPEIADRIRESQQHGEFSEDNSELDEVKFEQAMVENRIAELKEVFGSAIILEPQMIPTDYAGIGSLVTLLDLQFQDEFTIRLVSSVEADPSHDLVSNESPMGQAALGHSPGEDVSFEAPDGVKRFRIVSISR